MEELKKGPTTKIIPEVKITSCKGCVYLNLDILRDGKDELLEKANLYYMKQQAQ